MDVGDLDDAVFKALADSSRRILLDALADRDGQSLGELCERLPDMTRFGVMKHLAVLEHAQLVVAEKHGRRKLHYLNPVPIRRVHDRWVSRYTARFASALEGVRSELEGDSVDGTATTRVRDVHPGDAG